MKLIAILTIIIGFLTIGCMLANYYKKRDRFFEDLLYFCDLLVGEISFLQHKLLNIVDSHICSFSLQFQKVLIKYKEYLNNTISAQELTDYVGAVDLLSTEELNDISKFLLSLGRLDSDNELLKIKNYKNLFVKYSTLAKKDKSKYAPMFIKLGLIFGCIITIVLL